MSEMRPEYLSPSLSAAHVFLREEPAADDEEEEDGEDEDDDKGYSP